MPQCPKCKKILPKDGHCRVCAAKTQVAQAACQNATKGGVRYCGYEIGREITCEQVERLYHFLHANYTAIELIQMGDRQLHEIAEDNEGEWK